MRSRYLGTAMALALVGAAMSAAPVQAASTFGFDYWPAGYHNNTLNNANWTSLSPKVQADLDHIASLGGGMVRLMFWPENSGFTLPGNMGGGQIDTQLLGQITGNLPALLKLCADRNIKVTIAFGNDYLIYNDPATNAPWWTSSYGNTSQGFASFLHDSNTWMNAIVDAVEASPYAGDVVFYDLQNEYDARTVNGQWYISFVYDWTHIPANKWGVSVLDASRDAPDLVVALRDSAGPKKGSRYLNYVDFHSYMTPATYPNYQSNPPQASAQTLRNNFPNAKVLMGEFGYQTSVSSANGSADTLQQQTAELKMIDDAKAANVEYYLNWLLWDAIAPTQPSSRTPTFGPNPGAPRDVLGGVAAKLGLVYNPDMEIVSGGVPAGWSVGGTVPAVLSNQSGYAGNAQTNYNYARVSTTQTSGVVWLVSDQFAVKGGQQLFVNAYIRSSMRNVSMGIAEYDVNHSPVQNDSGPSYNPGSWGYVNYLQQIASTCSGAAIAQDQCSWHVTLQPNTAYAIVTINGQPAATAPSYLDVDTVSAWQTP